MNYPFIIILLMFLFCIVFADIRRLLIIYRIKKFHPKTYEGLGKPRYFGRSRSWGNTTYMEFMLYNDWKGLKDPKLSKIAKHSNLHMGLCIVLGLLSLVTYSLTSA